LYIIQIQNVYENSQWITKLPRAFLRKIFPFIFLVHWLGSSKYANLWLSFRFEKKNNRTIFCLAVNWLRCSCILGISLCPSKQGLHWSLYVLYFPLLPLVLNYIQLLLLLVIVNGTMSNMVLVLSFSLQTFATLFLITPHHKHIRIEMHVVNIYKYIFYSPPLLLHYRSRY